MDKAKYNCAIVLQAADSVDDHRPTCDHGQQQRGHDDVSGRQKAPDGGAAKTNEIRLIELRFANGRMNVYRTGEPEHCR